MNLLSADHLCKLLKLGIDEIKEPASEAAVPTSVIIAPVVGKKRDYKKATNYPDYTFYVQRDFGDDEIEVICEVVDIQYPEPNVGIRGYGVDIGDTWDKDGNPFPLTEMEHSAAERQAAESLCK